MKWITREKVKVDRVACPWLIKKFIDPQAEFVFLPADTDWTSLKEGIVYDVPGCELGHHGEDVSFDSILKKYGLTDPALDPAGPNRSGGRLATYRSPSSRRRAPLDRIRLQRAWPQRPRNAGERVRYVRRTLCGMPPTYRIDKVPAPCLTDPLPLLPRSSSSGIDGQSQQINRPGAVPATTGN